MQQIWADLMDALNPAQVDWILRNGREERIASGDLLVEEDGEVDAIFFLIEGLLHARTRALGGQVLATLGPGEIVGEISFVDRQRASATVVAAEDGLVLALPRHVLEAQLAADDAFAASFYRALAAIACRRLRATASRLGSLAGRRADDEDPALREDVEAAVERLRRTLIDADTAAAMADGTVPEAVALKVEREFRTFERALNDAIGELLDPPSPWNQQIGLRVQNELLPYISKTRLGERLYSKPRGYGGDFSALELIYRNQPSGSGPLGPLLDRCLLESWAIRALRGRRKIVAEEIRKTVDAAGTARVMSIACGPATEIFDVFAELDDKARLEPTLIDVDFQALLHVSELAYGLGLKDQVSSTIKNLVYLALGRGELEASDQDLVYSLGLIDYFNDNMVLRVIDHVHGVLRPGGRMLLGSFHPRNPSKAFLDHVLEWPLIHRTEDELSHLYERSAFGRPATAVRFDEQQIYFVSECVREG